MSRAHAMFLWLVALWTALAGCGSLPAVIASRNKTLLWIDTDSGFGRPGFDVDDGWALVAAFHSADVQVVGLSAVYGEAAMDDAYAVAGEFAGRFGPPGLKAYPGAHGPWELGRETNASKALAEALQHQPLKILALGPMTNIATLLTRHPELESQIVEIVAVAGQRPGERLGWGLADSKESADPNFERDLEAFRIVLHASGVPLTVVPLTSAGKVLIGEDDLHRLEIGGEAARTLAGPSRDWLELWRQQFGVSGFSPFDAAAAMYVATPALFRCRPQPAEIVLTAPDGPFFLASPAFIGSRTVRFCFDISPYYKEALLRRILSEQEFVYQEEPNLR